jgi:hypothetical protein
MMSAAASMMRAVVAGRDVPYPKLDRKSVV